MTQGRLSPVASKHFFPRKEIKRIYGRVNRTDKRIQDQNLSRAPTELRYFDWPGSRSSSQFDSHFTYTDAEDVAFPRVRKTYPKDFGFSCHNERIMFTNPKGFCHRDAD